MALLDRRRRYGKVKTLGHLRLKAITSGTFTFTIPAAIGTNYITSISYSTDNGASWVTVNNTSEEVVITTPTIPAGSGVLWKGIATGISTGSAVSKFSSTASFDASGNIMSLLYGDAFEGKLTLSSYTFKGLFQNSRIVNANDLLIPATTLANNCYQYMFYYCRSLTTAPVLPATTMAKYCYDSMFQGCTSLTTAPTLSATTLANNCYQYMFQDCTSLTTAPTLSATTLAHYCYAYMFRYCTSLNTAPVLPATTMKNYCYASMFQGCTSLTTAPTLSATTLANYCYAGMFSGCTSLTMAPVLPARTLVSYCYATMFNGCTSLSYIKAMFTTSPATSYTNAWVTNVKSTGTFVKNSAATWNVTGVNGIPSGWTVRTASS